MAEENREIKSVVTGDVEVREQKHTFWTDVKDIASGVFKDIIVPAGQDLLYDTIISSAQRGIYKNDDRGYDRGSIRGGRRDYTLFGSGRTRNYRGSSTRSNRQRSAGSVRGSRFEVDEIIFDNRADAEAVIDCVCEQLDRYEQVSVGEYYSACDLTPDSTDFNIGWYDLRGIEVVSAGRGKWTIVFPKATQLD